MDWLHKRDDKIAKNGENGHTMVEHTHVQSYNTTQHYKKYNSSALLCHTDMHMMILFIIMLSRNYTAKLKTFLIIMWHELLLCHANE